MDLNKELQGISTQKQEELVRWWKMICQEGYGELRIEFKNGRVRELHPKFSIKIRDENQTQES